MENISIDALQEYLSKQSKVFTTSNGLTIGQLEEGIYSSYKYSDEEIGFEYELFTDFDGFCEFIEHYRLESLGKIKELGYRDIWIRYLNRESEIQVTQSDMQEGPLTFRLYKSKTMIYSRELHFYDEVNRHLTIPEDFFDYFLHNEKKLQVAMGNMYRY